MTLAAHALVNLFFFQLLNIYWSITYKLHYSLENEKTDHISLFHS